MHKASTDRHECLSTDDVTVVLGCAVGERPNWIYWGPRLRDTSPEAIETLTTQQHVHGGPDKVLRPSVFAEAGSILSPAPGFAAHRDGAFPILEFRVHETSFRHEFGFSLDCVDARTNLWARLHVALDPETHIFESQIQITNHGEETLTLDKCASATLPLDQEANKILGFSGRWANEFQTEEVPVFNGAYVRENRTGRTSHHSFPSVIAKTDQTKETHGPCWGFHLGWSGNHELRVERAPDGQKTVQIGELFLPGEMKLAPGECFHAPPIYAGYSADGLSVLSQRFQSLVRNRLIKDHTRQKPRPVHYNTWEAVYFDHDPESLRTLASKAAEVGIERFVLDDGWFGSRRSDTSGLGDWYVSTDVYPDRLGPLIDHVLDLGMEFGLWFEPEMVNSDSDLFRNHPDWVLQSEGIEQVPFRNQLALDLTRHDVCSYLFGCLNALLSEYQISYIKWDMNRDLHHPVSQGCAVASTQTRAVYALMQKIRAAHPLVEIESCSSGGGRADYGVLQHTDRIWTSDSNDALDRQIIQRGAAHFFPLEVLGAHVGPRTCHITGRKLSMELRVATALFGHMGVELNLLDAPAHELDTLSKGIELYKALRQRLHSGAYFRLDTPAHTNAVSVVAADQSSALLSWCQLAGHTETEPGRIRFVGLDPATHYRVKIVWPIPAKTPTSPSIIDAADLNGEGTVFSGDALMKIGVQAPVLLPESCLIFDARQVEAV